MNLIPKSPLALDKTAILCQTSNSPCFAPTILRVQILILALSFLPFWGERWKTWPKISWLATLELWIVIVKGVVNCTLCILNFYNVLWVVCCVFFHVYFAFCVVYYSFFISYSALRIMRCALCILLGVYCTSCVDCYELHACSVVCIVDCVMQKLLKTNTCNFMQTSFVCKFRSMTKLWNSRRCITHKHWS